MSPKDLLFALVVVVVVAWRINFAVIKVGLHGVPPMSLGALHFILAGFPAVFFVKRPQLPWRWLLAYGVTISFCQFVFLFRRCTSACQRDSHHSYCKPRHFSR